MTDAEKLAFCGSGKLLSVECQTINKIPSYSAGDLGTTCDLANGIVCKGMDNYPIGCQDYMIRYQCQEQVCGGITDLWKGYIILYSPLKTAKYYLEICFKPAFNIV
jgi:hypothetical protein